MKNVRHVGIVVRDLERALRFYRDLLGLREDRVMDESGPYLDNMLGAQDVRVTTIKLSADSGATLVELLHFAHPAGVRRDPVTPWTPGPTHVAFTVEDIDGLYERLSASGVSFNAPPQQSPDGRARVTYCQDPEGTFVELVELQHGQRR